MPVIIMESVSQADALAYRDAVIAREPARLGELAGWLTESGGPLEEMDASLESLLALWPWYIRFVEADCPGIPADAVGQWSVHDDTLPRPTRGRRHYSSEAIGHYLMLVARRLDPSAAWQPNPDSEGYRYQQTGILLRTKAFVIPDVLMDTTISRAVELPPHRAASHREPEELQRVFLAWAGLDIPSAHQDRRPSVLPAPQPVPDPPPIWWRPQDPHQTPPPRTPAIGAAIPLASVPEPRSAGTLDVAALTGASSDLYLFRGPNQGIEQPDLLSPLPLPDLVSSLTSLGLTTDPQHDAHDDGATTQTWHLPDHEPDLAVEAQITTIDNTPRLLAVYFHGDPTTPTGTRIAATIATLAERLHARLTNYDEANIDD